MVKLVISTVLNVFLLLILYYYEIFTEYLKINGIWILMRKKSAYEFYEHGFFRLRKLEKKIRKKERKLLQNRWGLSFQKSQKCENPVGKKCTMIYLSPLNRFSLLARRVRADLSRHLDQRARRTPQSTTEIAHAPTANSVKLSDVATLKAYEARIDGTATAVSGNREKSTVASAGAVSRLFADLAENYARYEPGDTAESTV